MQRHSANRDALDAAFDRLLEAALDDYVQKQEAFAQRISGLSRWSIDHDALMLEFGGDGGQGFKTPFIPIATYLPSRNSWAWAWANDAFHDQARSRASSLVELSQTTGYKIFESPSFPVALEEIDELCALALVHLGAQAIFKIKDAEPWEFLAIA